MATKDTARRAAIYTRISLDKTGEAVGVARQEADCRALAEANGWDVIAETYCDNDRSAYDRRKARPAFDRMMADCAAGRVDVVMVWAADRLYRRMADLERIVDTLNAAGARVVTVKSGDIDLATADGRSVARILGSMSQRESEKTGERVAAAAKARAEGGRSTTGRRPFGWNMDGSINEAEAGAVRDAFGMLLEGVSVSGIARELTGRGLRSSEGGPIRQSRVSAWLRNPRHAGLVTYKGKVVAESEGIIDHRTWNRAQALLADPKRRPKKGRPHSTLLGGLLSCGVCAAPLKPSSNSVNGGRRIETYACEPHRHVNRSRADLDAWARELMARRLDQHAPQIRERIAAQQHDGAAPARAQIADLEQERLDLAALLAARQLPAKDFAAATTAIAAQIEALEVQAEAAAGLAATSAVLSAADIRAEVLDLERERFRAVWSECVESAIVPRGGGAPKQKWS